MDLEIIESADGSHTLYNCEINEHYHSVHGAEQESNHVFFDMGLSKCLKDKIEIFEVGFGTGLNAYMSAMYAMQNHKKIIYTTIEAFPVPCHITEKLNYGTTKQEKSLFNKISNCSWNTPIVINEYFTLIKMHADFIKLNLTLNNEIDLIFFDAFSPDVQPEMWEQNIFDYLYEHTSNNGIITTYCAKGIVRRRMKAAGFEVERLPGPPGKREMLRGTKKVDSI